MSKLIQNRGWLIAICITILTFATLLIIFFSNSVTVKVNQLNVRSGPAVSYPVKGIVKKGAHLQVIKRQNDWLQVIANHRQVGWVASWLVNETKLNHPSKIAETTIVLDPGHGGEDTGALSTSNQQEQKYTLQIAKKVAKKLKNTGARVILTRNSNKTVSLTDRPEIAEQNHADAFVSFHLDSSDQPNSASGVTSYYYHAGKSKQMATAVNTQLRNLPLPNRGVQFGDFLVIRDTSVPSILLETGYINTDTNFDEIKSPKYQAKVANDVTRGLTKYFADQS